MPTLGLAFLIASLISLAGIPENIERNSRRAPQNCEEALNGRPYRYLYTDNGLIYQTCKEENGKPVVTTDHKDKGWRETKYFR